ncbi:MAG: YcaQ family DNA glycosylase [Nitrososphaerota archaeon]|nr:YcaQ family DNA glycosylase [Nitrososphaerota archaeon]MDG6956468.1 YcaQ family DNA glycosylase [Nitrososphaerota archaeon]MDG6957613.1 YcaQ family DNA glycosylase [Nitrososphaerota archaeon]MDG6959762.1 YcaQ family DNA glycosylase [Nitrososphaerota archaeon]MDG6968180.1 YcaQ family DNA glycosylase [Nitrososphaerota archaeon]
MTGAAIAVSLETARRLTVIKQRLVGGSPKRATRDDILSLVKDLAYVQWDPVTVVAPSHLLSIWARLGGFRPSDLEGLLWDEKKLFEHWLPFASIVLTEDYPIYASLMKRYPGSLAGSWKPQSAEAAEFLASRRALKRAMLRALSKGPLLVSQFEEHLRTARNEGDWAPASDAEEMMFHLHMSGEVMVVGHQGSRNVWGLTGGFLPRWVKTAPLAEGEYERRAAERAILALGTATASEVNYYFPRGRYRTLRKTLASLEGESVIRRISVEGLGRNGPRYIHERDLPLLGSAVSDAWRPRMALLPPFDNLVSSIARTKALFGFDYVREQFLPKEKRRFGTYVLPILWGDRLIGRIDPWLDKRKGVLHVNSVHAEKGAPAGSEVSRELAETIERLSEFVGAREVVYTERVPRQWKGSLR